MTCSSDGVGIPQPVAGNLALSTRRQPLPRAGNATGPAVLRKCLPLPLALLGGDDRGVAGDGGLGGGRFRVAGNATGVPGHMGVSSGLPCLTSRMGDGTGRGVIGRSRSRVGGNRSRARLPCADLAARPGKRRLDVLPRPVVVRVLPLEVREHPFGAVRRPEC